MAGPENPPVRRPPVDMWHTNNVAIATRSSQRLGSTNSAAKPFRFTAEYRAHNSPSTAAFPLDSEETLYLLSTRVPSSSISHRKLKLSKMKALALAPGDVIVSICCDIFLGCCLRDAEVIETADEFEIEELQDCGRGRAFALDGGKKTVITLCGCNGSEKFAILADVSMANKEKDEIEFVERM
ncbi:hypothetical protein ABW21_db0207316 [Orbilia brochopaga]|nr:hypothetical protein ABW21_db0207316 [Drechslerella brochopaga]